MRLNALVVRVPDVDVGDFVAACAGARVSGAATCSLMPKKTRWLSSLQSSGARSLTTQPFGKPAAFAGSSFAGAYSASPSAACTFGIDEQDVVALAHLVDVHALEHGEAGAVVVPRQPAVDARVVVERVDAAAVQVEHEQSVAVARPWRRRCRRAGRPSC